MKNQSFTIHLRNDQNNYDAIEEKLLSEDNPGMVDGPDFVFGMTAGRLYISYDREAPTMNEAILGATAEAISAGAVIERVETNEESVPEDSQKLTYGQMVATRGPIVSAKEIDRLQHKIVTAQQMIDPCSKVSAILFLEEKNWDAGSYSDWIQEWRDYADSVQAG